MLEFTFDNSPLEALLEEQAGGTVSGAALLTALEEEGAETLWEQLVRYDVLPQVEELPACHGDSETALRLRREEKLIREGDLLRDLEQTDPLRLYLEEVAAIPVCGDEALLAEDMARLPEDRRETSPLRQRLTDLSLSRIISLAGDHTGRGVLLLDLIQEGSMGLWQSLPQFPGGDFAAFRDRRIRMAMGCAVLLQAHAAGVGQSLRRSMEDYRTVEERLLGELGRTPAPEELAEALHMTPEQVAVLGDMVDTARALDRVKAPRQNEQLPEEEDQAVENTAYFQMRQRIAELLERLEEQDRSLLTLRYGLEGGLPLSPEQTGQRLGLTAQEVAQREAAALALLRK